MEQEYLEDYIKLSQNIDAPKNGHSKVENFITTSQKRKECEDRAIKIVELLLEGTVRPETFLKSIVYLNSTYYQDIVEERAIAKLCGYALCGKKLKTVSSNKRYSISTKNNKVYDLNEYGYFCSIHCFNASNYVKNQIDDSPLWLRDFEDIPTFNLLPKKDGHLSKGIDLRSKVTSTSHQDFVPVTSFAELSLNDFVQLEDTENDKSKCFKLSTVLKSEELCRLKKSQEKKNSKQHLETLIEDEAQEKTHPIYDKEEQLNEKQDNVISFIKKSNDITKNLGDLDKHVVTKLTNNISLKERVSKHTNDTCSEISGQSDEYLKQIAKTSPCNSEKSYFNAENDKITKKLSNLKDLNQKIKNKFTKTKVKLIDPIPLKTETFQIEKKNNQHNTDELMLKDSPLLKLRFSHKNFLQVENQVRSSVKQWITLDTLIFIHGENKIKEILNEKKLNEYYDKLKVAQLEVTQQHKYASICKRLQMQELLDQKWDSEFASSKMLRPVPDFTDLRKEKRELDIKVKHFLGGMLYEADDSNFHIKETQENEEENVPVVLPLVDVNSQNALRRRVLLTNLNKSIKFFLKVVKCNSTTMFSDLQDLIKTLKLSADNVVFKPIVSDYLGFICLKILALRDCQLRDLLKKREAIQYENLIFDFLPGKSEVCHSCLNLIENVDIFIGNYVVSET
ncbi:hypothetical protein WA026_013893 [Henosepilachna vigintioctopunctata]|uniref:RNA polymerase II subunit B1 CTD phosphatase RPAP2 homolog n=1 Tax=Henosepilachna vigintioctopunctata TaxID=420089 RepID=A0AAW1U788_9CUCU